MAKDIEVYTLVEVKDLLGVSRRTLYDWIKAGKLKAFKAGKEWRVTRKAVEEFTEHGTEDN